MAPLRKSSPWLSVWLKPGDTIDRVLAENPRRSVILLAALTGVANLLTLLSNSGVTVGLVDWRTLAVVAAFGPLLGIVSLVLSAVVMCWIGRLLAGRAVPIEMRAAIAWSSIPVVAGGSIYLVVLFGLRVFEWPAPDLAQLVLSAGFIVFALLELWALVAFLRMVMRVQRFGFWRALANGALSLLFSLFIAALFRTFAFQPYRIPSTAMHPTLLEGDQFMAAKLSYGYGRYSLPFSPALFSGHIFASEPRYADVVVFRLPRDDSVDYVMRVVGLPGDRVQMINSVLTINGTPVGRAPLDDCVQVAMPGTGRFRCWRETLPNGASHAVLNAEETGFLANTREYVVPPGHYFMMGDNRDNSNDSRIPASQGGVGFVPFENLVGRAAIIFLSIKQSAPDEPATLRLDRMGTAVR